MEQAEREFNSPLAGERRETGYTFRESVLNEKESKEVTYRRIVQMSLLALIVLTLAVSPALAAKPDGSNGSQDVIARSNGYPSGAHFNLNVHGKKASFTGDPEPGGNSVFILEYGSSTIEYVTNKKSSLTELTVLDPLAEAFD